MGDPPPGGDFFETQDRTLECAYCGRNRSRDTDSTCPGCGASELREVRSQTQPSLVGEPQMFTPNEVRELGRRFMARWKGQR